MTSIKAMRQGLAANLSTIPGMRTSYFIPDNVNPPCAVITPPTIRYDLAMGRGTDQYDFQVIVLVTRADERIGQDLIDSYCAPSGAGSVKAAIESDRTLAGSVFDLRVTDMTGVAPQQFEDGQVYLTATFAVTAYAQ